MAILAFVLFKVASETEEMSQRN